MCQWCHDAVNQHCCLNKYRQGHYSPPINHRCKILLLTEGSQIVVEMREMGTHLTGCGVTTYLGWCLCCTGSSSFREEALAFYLQDLQHTVPHWQCSKLAYWLIWVISEENVTNLCRKCCNWISATRIMRSSSQECIWKPQLFADSKLTLFLEWPSLPAPASTFTRNQ